MTNPDKKRVELLTKVVIDTIWMARRYADQRATFAPTTVNEAIDTLLAMGIDIKDDVTLGRYARDYDPGYWDPNRGRWVRTISKEVNDENLQK